MPHSEPEACALRWVPGAGSVDIHPLAVGLVNASYRVARSGRRYSLRVAASTSGDLGVDREWECRVLAAASAAGLAPAIRYCDAAEGVLVADWIDGRAWTAEETLVPHNIRAMALLLRRVHGLPLPRPARSMNPAAWMDLYTGALARRDSRAASLSPALRDGAHARLRRLQEAEPARTVLCHSDLHRFNVAVGAHPAAPVLLDWEYAHASDPYWDLAGWVANNDWAAPAAADFLSAYLGRPAALEEMARLRLWGWLYDYVALIWSELYLRQGGGTEGAGTGAFDGVAARVDVLSARLTS